MTFELSEIFLDRPFAHRGLHDIDDGRPENSRSAFQAAIDGGFGIELDVQLTADKEAVVFHDYALKRLTGESGVIRNKTSQDMRNTPLLGGSDNAETLADILDFIDGRAPLLVEIKDQDGAMGTDIGSLEEATAKAVQNYRGPLALMSFNPNSVVKMAELCPNIPRGLVTSAYATNVWPFSKAVCDRLRGIPDYARSGACFISHEVADLDRPRVAELKSEGATIFCWTVTSQDVADTALNIADNITFENYLPT